MLWNDTAALRARCCTRCSVCPKEVGKQSRLSYGMPELVISRPWWKTLVGWRAGSKNQVVDSGHAYVSAVSFQEQQKSSGLVLVSTLPEHTRKAHTG